MVVKNKTNTNPYEDILTTNLGIKLEAPTKSPLAPAPLKQVTVPGQNIVPVSDAPVKPSTNPYEDVLNNVLASSQQAKSQKVIDESQAVADKTLNPGFFRSALDVIKELPNAGKQILAHPVTSVVGAASGLLNLGPGLINNISGLFSEKARNNPAPMPGTKLFDLYAHYVDLDQKAKDVGQATSTAGEAFGGYELGGAIAKVAPILKTASPITQRIAGNIIGGQLTASPEMTAKQRGEQALFDGLFGAGTEAVGYGVNKLIKKPAPIPKEVAEFVPPELQNATEITTPQNPFQKADSALKQNEIKYVPKRSLGLDETGQPIQARTHIDHATGNAVIEYLQKYDNPKMAEVKNYLLDLEHGHIVDKRINGGTNLSAELPNPTGNAENLARVLDNLSEKLNEPVENVATKLNQEIKDLSGGKEINESEAFSKAFAEFRSDPVLGAQKAPTFAKFLEEPLQEPRFVTRETTVPKMIKENTPRQIEDKIKTESVVKVGEKQMKLSGKAHEEYQAMKREYEDTIKAMSGYNAEHYAKTKKGMGMRFSAKVRELTGEYTPTELSNLLERELSNYPGKNVIVKVNGKDISGKIKGKPAFGNFKVELDDGTLLSGVSAGEIKDPRPKAQIIKDLTTRKGVEEFNANTTSNPTVNKQTGAVSAKAKIQANIQSKAKTTMGELEGGTGLDTGKRIKNKPGMNFDKINAPQEVKDLLIKMDKDNGNFSQQRMSKNFNKIDELSRLVGLTPEELMSAKPGSIVNTETLAKARQLVVDQAQDLANFLKTFNSVDAKPEQLKLMREKYETLVAMQKAVAGYSSEAGTLLNSLKREVTPGENATLQQLADKLKSMGIEDAEQLANRVGKIAVPTKLERAGERFLSIWYQAILSGPKTVTRNVLGNTANILTQLASKIGNPNQWKEIIPAGKAFIDGFKEGIPAYFENIKSSFKGKQSNLDTKFMDATDPTRPSVWGESKVGKFFEKTGNVVNSVLSDKPFSSASKAMEEAALKVYSPEVSDSLQKALSNYYSEKSVFHGMPGGRATGAVVKSAELLRREFPPTRVIIPFVRTVGNIIDQQLDYVPVISHMRAYQGNFIERQLAEVEKITGYKLSGAEKELARQRLQDHAVGKAWFGVAIAGSALALATKGNISGTGPSNYQERLQLMRTGWRPNSIKIGDTWIPYQNLGPLAGLLSMAGNIHDGVTYDNKKGENIASTMGLGLLGWMQSELNSSFMQGSAKLLDAIANKNGAYFAEDLPASLIPVPAAYSQTKDLIFRQQYETSGLIDKIRLKLGLTGDAFGLNPLEEKLNAFGEPMTADAIYGVSPSKEKASLVDQFLIANDIVVTKPSSGQLYTIPYSDKKKRALTEKEYTEYVKESGKEIYQQLQDAIPTMEYMDQEERKAYVQKITDSVRKSKRNEILLRY